MWLFNFIRTSYNVIIMISFKLKKECVILPEVWVQYDKLVGCTVVPGSMWSYTCTIGQNNQKKSQNHKTG